MDHLRLPPLRFSPPKSCATELNCVLPPVTPEPHRTPTSPPPWQSTSSSGLLLPNISHPLLEDPTTSTFSPVSRTPPSFQTLLPPPPHYPLPALPARPAPHSAPWPYPPPAPTSLQPPNPPTYRHFPPIPAVSSHNPLPISNKLTEQHPATSFQPQQQRVIQPPFQPAPRSQIPEPHFIPTGPPPKSRVPEPQFLPSAPQPKYEPHPVQTNYQSHQLQLQYRPRSAQSHYHPRPTKFPPASYPRPSAHVPAATPSTTTPLHYAKTDPIPAASSDIPTGIHALTTPQSVDGLTHAAYGAGASSSSSAPGASAAFVAKSPVKKTLQTSRGLRDVYACPYANCTRVSTEQSNMKAHMRMHTGEKPYVCRTAGCGKAFRWKSSLTYHEKALHVNARPFKCAPCRRSFVEKRKLRMHFDLCPVVRRRRELGEGESLSGGDVDGDMGIQ